MKWQLLRDITQDIYRQFHYFTMVTSDQILKKDFFFFAGIERKMFLVKVPHPAPLSQDNQFILGKTSTTLNGLHNSVTSPAEGNGNPLWYSCL